MDQKKLTVEKIKVGNRVNKGYEIYIFKRAFKKMVI